MSSSLRTSIFAIYIVALLRKMSSSLRTSICAIYIVALLRKMSSPIKTLICRICIVALLKMQTLPIVTDSFSGKLYAVPCISDSDFEFMNVYHIRSMKPEAQVKKNWHSEFSQTKKAKKAREKDRKAEKGVMILTREASGNEGDRRGSVVEEG
ncbi:hypothetical protein BDQ17DRAFT_1338959 [Cyathus striatus]|nr:hypothetical protein BDQ17DRAFT_1338959 [Cyathus striatus]